MMRRIAAVGFVLFLLAAVGLRAGDPPHDVAPGPTDCDDCHSTHAAVGFFNINQAFIQDLCAACHDGVTATQVATHQNPTKGPWQGRDYDGNGQDIVCTDCHFQHRLARRQVRWNKKTGELIIRKVDEK